MEGNSLEQNKELFNSLHDELRQQYGNVYREIIRSTYFNMLDSLDGDYSIISNLFQDIEKKYRELFNITKKNNSYEYKEKLRRVRKDIIFLKQSQISKYNELVFLINQKIEQLKAKNVLDNDIKKEINDLEKISTCEIKIVKYDQKKYLDEIDYSMLAKYLNKIEFIEKSILNEKISKIEQELSLSVEFMSKEIEKFRDYMNQDNIIIEQMKSLISDIGTFKGTLLDNFKTKLNEYKDVISSESYNNYLQQIASLETDISKIEQDIDTRMNMDDYNDLVNSIDMIDDEVNNYIMIIDAIASELISDKTAEIFNNRLNLFLDRINVIYDKINEFNFKERNQKTSLENKVNKIIDSIKEIKGKISENTLVNNNQIKNVKDIEKEIDELFSYVHVDNDIIRDKNKRENIKNRISNIYVDINLLEMSSNNDVNLSKNIARLRSKLNIVNDGYIRKCPMVIKQIKVADNFYKKHNKTVLAASGLAIVALTSSAIGNVIVPAIIFGNMILSEEHPILDKLNDILGKVIGAKKNEDGTWMLSNGIKVNSSSAITALLKSLASCKVSHYVGKIVNKIKDLSSKIALKERFRRLGNNIQESSEDLKLMRLYLKYRNSNKEINEFCKEMALNEEEQEKLKAYLDYKEACVERTQGHGR